MEFPRFETDPCSPFLQDLRQRGFTKWVTLPKQQGFFSALAFALLLHTVPNYEDYAGFMQKTWIKVVNPLCEVDEEMTKLWGEQRYLHTHYWTELGRKCYELCEELFKGLGKSFVTDRLRSVGVVDLSNKLYFSAIANYFNSCICVYECLGSTKRTTEFYEMQEGKLAVIVCLAIEGEEVSVLIHRDFAFDRLYCGGFPNYLKLKRSQWQTPNIWSEDWENSELKPHSDTQAIVGVLTTIAENLALIAASVKQGIPACAYNSLQRQVEALSSSTNLQSLHNSLCSLRSKPLVWTSCEGYCDSGLSLEFHSHRFHADCLRQFLAESERMEDCSVQCPRCKQTLPPEVLKAKRCEVQPQEDDEETTDIPFSASVSRITSSLR